MNIQSGANQPVDSGSLHGSMQMAAFAHAAPAGESVQTQYALDLRNLMQALDHHAIVSIADTRGRITYVNEMFCEISGYRPDELLGQNHRLLKSGHHPDSVFQEMWETISSGKPWQGEIKNRKKNGEHYWVSSTIMPFLDENGLPYQYISIRTEITRQKRLQESLARNEERYRRQVEQVPVGMFELNAAGACYFVNERWCRMAGITTEQALGEGWLNAVYPEDRLRFVEEWSRTRDSDEEFQIECRFGSRAQSLRWVTVTAEKITDAQGNVTGYLGSASDITRLKKSEAELMVAKLTAESASRAKSEFLSRMSHELRTPLNAILGFSQLMECDEATPLPPCHQESNQQVLRAGRHLLELINEVLDLSRIETGNLDIQLEETSIRALLGDCMALLAPLAAKSEVKLGMSGEGDCLVWADSRRLMQILLNLLSNAIKYNREGGRATVSWAPHGNDMLRISVRDTGHGIPESRLLEVFEPFNRLAFDNSEIEGAGIGLAIASKLAALMHGSIEVESAEGQGSVFHLHIPLATKTSLPLNSRRKS